MKEMWQAIKIDPKDINIQGLSKDHGWEYAVVTEPADDTPSKEAFDGKGKYYEGFYIAQDEPLAGDIIAFKPNTYVYKPVKGKMTAFLSKSFIAGHFTEQPPVLPEDCVLRSFPDYIQGSFSKNGETYSITALPVVA